MNLADQRVEVVDYAGLAAGHAGRPATSRNARVAIVTQRLRPYGLAVAFIALTVAQGVLAQLLGWDKLAFPFVLMGVGAAVWYAGPGPGVLAILLGGLCFNYFFTLPLYSFEIHPAEGPYFVAFV